MMKVMKNLLAGSYLSTSTWQVLDVLSDRISVHLFSTIAERVNTSENIRQLLGVSAKQYYTRQSYLMKTGLIERRHSVLTLTAFGQLVYSALLIIASACRQYSELLIIDVVKSTEGIPSKEQKDLINKLIIDPRIKKLILTLI